jgi:hypothetical protein
MPCAAWYKIPLFLTNIYIGDQQQISIPVIHFDNVITLCIAIKDYLYHSRPKHNLLGRDVDDETWVFEEISLVFSRLL